MNLIESIRRKAAAAPKRIVFPEGQDERILAACRRIKDEGIAIPIILGHPDWVRAHARQLGVGLDDITIIDHQTAPEGERYAAELFALRKAKGMTLAEAQDLVRKPNYFGTMMVQLGEAEGLVSGATHTTADTLRPALQIIKTKPGVTTASSYFAMMIGEQPLFFADCGFIVDPTAEQLSEIAIATADSARSLGIEPRVAMLSFSTKGSGSGASPDKVKAATALVRQKRPDIILDGELQVDAAIVPEVAKKKCPDSPLRGTANVLVFPNLDAGNIGYKLVQRLANASAIGPVVQGLRKPVNDLSRGCSVQDVIDVTAITVIEAQQ